MKDGISVPFASTHVAGAKESLVPRAVSVVPLAKVSTGPVKELIFLRVATVAGAGEAIVSIVADVANVAELISTKQSLKHRSIRPTAIC